MAQQPVLAHLALWGLQPILFKTHPSPHWPNLAFTPSLFDNFFQASLGPSGLVGLASQPVQHPSKASLAQLGCHSLLVELLAKSFQASGEALGSMGVQVRRLWGLLCAIWACWGFQGFLFFFFPSGGVLKKKGQAGCVSDMTPPPSQSRGPWALPVVQVDQVDQDGRTT